MVPLKEQQARPKGHTRAERSRLVPLDPLPPGTRPRAAESHHGSGVGQKSSSACRAGWHLTAANRQLCCKLARSVRGSQRGSHEGNFPVQTALVEAGARGRRIMKSGGCQPSAQGLLSKHHGCSAMSADCQQPPKSPAWRCCRKPRGEFARTFLLLTLFYFPAFNCYYYIDGGGVGQHEHKGFRRGFPCYKICALLLTFRTCLSCSEFKHALREPVAFSSV